MISVAEAARHSVDAKIEYGRPVAIVVPTPIVSRRCKEQVTGCDNEGG